MSEFHFACLPIDFWIVGAQPSHSYNHILAANVGDKEPLRRNMTLEMTGKFRLMSDGGSVESVVGIAGIDRRRK